MTQVVTPIPIRTACWSFKNREVFFWILGGGNSKIFEFFILKIGGFMIQFDRLAFLFFRWVGSIRFPTLLAQPAAGGSEWHPWFASGGCTEWPGPATQKGGGEKMTRTSDEEWRGAPLRMSNILIFPNTWCWVGVWTHKHLLGRLFRGVRKPILTRYDSRILEDLGHDEKLWFFGKKNHPWKQELELRQVAGKLNRKHVVFSQFKLRPWGHWWCFVGAHDVILFEKAFNDFGGFWDLYIFGPFFGFSLVFLEVFSFQVAVSTYGCWVFWKNKNKHFLPETIMVRSLLRQKTIGSKNKKKQKVPVNRCCVYHVFIPPTGWLFLGVSSWWVNFSRQQIAVFFSRKGVTFSRSFFRFFFGLDRLVSYLRATPLGCKVDLTRLQLQEKVFRQKTLGVTK